jgi:hypothetical protein
MMGEGQHMYGGQDAKSRQQMQQTDPAGGQTYHQYMNPGMMGSYGYGMGPQMMGGGYGMYPGMMGGGYGYGMMPNMMGYGMGQGMMGGYGCGYGMNPGMMGGHGYGMGPGMMGGYGYGMHPGMMGYGMGPGMMQGYGMNPGMMGGYGMGYGMYPGMMGYGSQEDYKKYKDRQEKFLEETKELRRKLHSMKFDFSEEAAKPEANREKLQKMEKEMNELYEKIREKAIQ